MNIAPRFSSVSAASRILKLAAVVLFGWSGQPGLARTVQPEVLAARESNGVAGSVPVTVTSGLLPASGLQTAAQVLPASDWYKSKAWWKRHAPIIGGAAGGGAVGGLLGGGKGAIIGGAAGAGGGYLYERHRDRSLHHARGNTANRTTPKRPRGEK